MIDLLHPICKLFKFTNMKKILFICCIAVSAFAVSSSASISKHQNFSGYVTLSDTTPRRTSDSMKHQKMHNQNNMNNQNNNQNNMNSQNNMTDSGMSMKSDSTSTAPPRK
jgi:hypothetical protein